MMSLQSRWLLTVGLGLYATSAIPTFGQLAETISLDREVRVRWGGEDFPIVRTAEHGGPWLGTIEGRCNSAGTFVKANQASWVGCDGLFAAGECASYHIGGDGQCATSARNSLRYSFALKQTTSYEIRGQIEKSDYDYQSFNASCAIYLREFDGRLVYFDEVEACQGCDHSVGHCIRAHGSLPSGLYEFEIQANGVRGGGTGPAVTASYEIELSFLPETGGEPPVMSLVDPPPGTIDARQDRSAGSDEPQGIDQVVVEFSNAVFDAFTGDSPSAESFDVSDTSGEPISIASVRRPSCPFNGDGLPTSSDVPNAFSLTLDRPIRPGHWTTIVANVMDPNGNTVQNRVDGVRIGFLPGDVNGDGLANPGSELLALIDSLNGVLGRVRSKYSTDINRNAVANPQDILRLIDLLNGVDTTRVWAASALPGEP